MAVLLRGAQGLRNQRQQMGPWGARLPRASLPEPTVNKLTPKTVAVVAAVMVILGAISRAAFDFAGVEVGWFIVYFPFICGVVVYFQPNVRPRTLWIALIAMPAFFLLMVTMAGTTFLKTVDFEQKTINMHRWSIAAGCQEEDITEKWCARWSQCIVDTLVEERTKQGAYIILTQAAESPPEMEIFADVSTRCAEEGVFPAPKPQQALDVTAGEPPPAPDMERGKDTIARYVVQLAGGEAWLYLPSQDITQAAVLPAVVIAPAGSDLLHGMPLAEGDTPEHLPYAEAGFVVLAYTLAGQDDAKAFQATDGGLRDALNAVAFLRKRVPMVDPDAIFAAGHSSAANVALLLGAHDDKLRGVAAYNHDAQGCWTQSPGFLERSGDSDPTFERFCQRSRSASHFGHFKIPAFFFGSKEDTITPAGDVAAAAALLKKSNADVTLKIVDTQDHYQSMTDEGIPAGIAWMKAKLDGVQSDEAQSDEAQSDATK